MKKVVPYVIFGIAYFVLGLIVGMAVDEIPGRTASLLLNLLVPVAVAPIAIVAARRAGQLSTLGVLMVTILSALALYMLITGILSAIAAPTGGSVSLLSLARTGGWWFALSYAIYVMAPVLWTQLLNSHDARSAQAGTVG